MNFVATRVGAATDSVSVVRVFETPMFRVPFRARASGMMLVKGV